MTTTTPPTPSVQLLEVSPEYAGQRIDNFLLARLKGVPKTLIYRILRKGEVLGTPLSWVRKKLSIRWPAYSGATSSSCTAVIGEEGFVILQS